MVLILSLFSFIGHDVNFHASFARIILIFVLIDLSRPNEGFGIWYGPIIQSVIFGGFFAPKYYLHQDSGFDADFSSAQDKTFHAPIISLGLRI